MCLNSKRKLSGELSKTRVAFGADWCGWRATSIRTACDGSHMIAHIWQLNTTAMDDTSQTLPSHVANIAFKTTSSSR